MCRTASLLTKEFHALFDRGYVTVTPDYQVRVSAALREDWQNGVRYYAHDRTLLKILPRPRPSARAVTPWRGTWRTAG
ncbi:MAG: hypothetical protein R3F60_14595 [bacterium]